MKKIWKRLRKGWYRPLGKVGMWIFVLFLLAVVASIATGNFRLFLISIGFYIALLAAVMYAKGK